MTSKNSPLIITGMHRSGTSLIASILQAAGVHIGQNLLAPNALNPRGFFEDADFYQFHQEVLYRSGARTPYVDQNFTYVPTPAETEQAKKLVADRSHIRLWGWKDPRSCLFLDFWRHIAPRGRYLFVYRHPLEVLFSFMRRREIHTIGLLEALNSWYVYNKRVLDFFQQNQSQCILSHTYALLDQPDEFVALANNKYDLSLNLDAEIVAQHYQPNELNKLPPTKTGEALLEKIHPYASQLYQSLNEAADLSWSQLADNSQPQPELDYFYQFLAVYPFPLTDALKRASLQFLAAVLAPDLLNDYFINHGQQIVQLYEKNYDLEVSGQQLQAWSDKQAAHVQELIEIVEKQKNRIDVLEAELASIPGLRVYRASRRLVDSLLGRMPRKLSRTAPSAGDGNDHP